MGYLDLEALGKVFTSRDGKPGSETAAVDDVWLSIDRGELVTLLGPSGCGKTTTLRLVAGFEAPTSGRIVLEGEDIHPLPAHRRGMAMVFQSYALFPHLSVFENVAYGLRITSRPESEVRERVGEALDLVELGGLDARGPHQLSGGQQQRVALARALVVRPRLLLFDEPLSNLDASLRDQMRFQIRALQRRLGITALYVTHDQSEAMALSDRVVVMHRGRIAQAGTPVAVYRRPATPFVGGFLGRASFVPVTVERDASGAHARIGGTAYPATGPGTDANGPAVAMLRPEDLEVGRADGFVPVGMSAVSGAVRRATFLGAVTDYEVALETGVTVTVHDVGARDVALVQGDPVRVWPKGRALYVLSAE